MAKELDTLIEDINKVLVEGVDTIPKEVLDTFNKACGSLLFRFLKKSRVKKPSLRMSNIGKPDRQLWFELHSDGAEESAREPNMYLKFLIGDIAELVLLALAQLAGHKVESLQEEVQIEGVTGHMDAVIDDTVVDVKSASGYSFETKFQKGGLKEHDYFGYIDQVSGYNNALKKTNGAAFLAYNKESAETCLLKIPQESIRDTKGRIRHIRDILDSDTPPEEKCYKPFVNKKGSLELNRLCVWCPFKFKCWEGLKAYRYSMGDVFIVEERGGEYKAPDVTQEYLDKLKNKKEENSDDSKV